MAYEKFFWGQESLHSIEADASQVGRAREKRLERQAGFSERVKSVQENNLAVLIHTTTSN